MWKSITILALGSLAAVTALPAHCAIPLKFFGTATAGDITPRIAEAMANTGVDVTGFDCFQTPVLDLGTGLKVGTGVDCLNVFSDAGDDAGEGLQIEAKTFFFLPSGILVNHGCTSVRPFFAGVGDAGVTHITGSIGPQELGGMSDPNAPPPCDSVGGIIFTSGSLRNYSGEVRLSGAVDLSQVGSGVITFSCLFVLDVRPPGHPFR